MSPKHLMWQMGLPHEIGLICMADNVPVKQHTGLTEGQKERAGNTPQHTGREGGLSSNFTINYYKESIL